MGMLKFYFSIFHTTSSVILLLGDQIHVVKVNVLVLIMLLVCSAICPSRNNGRIKTIRVLLIGLVRN